MTESWYALTQSHRSWAERAEALAVTELAPRAAEIDRTAHFPSASLDTLKEGGLWALRVDKQHGGLGEDLLTTALVVEALARHCPSTALCYKMHLEASELLCRIGTPDQAQRLIRPIVSGDALYTVAGSETPGGGGAWAPTNFISPVTPVDDGYRIDGVRKAYVTSADFATHFFFLCRVGQDASPLERTSLVVEADQVKWTVNEPWDGFGMRGNNSSPVTFNGTVSQANLLGGEGKMSEHGMKLTPVVLATYGAVYLGIAAGALDQATAYVRHEYAKGLRRIDSAVTQRRMAELSVDIERSRALLYAAAAAFDQGTATTMAPYYQAKVACSETGARVTAEVMSLGGGTAFAKRLPFERYFRDARAGIVMGIANDTALTGLAEVLYTNQ